MSGSAIRNPTWARDELILALGLYMNHRDRLPDVGSDEVVALSALLNKLGAELSRKSDSFRNANGVYMKLNNFRSIDPQYTSAGKSGLKRGGKGDGQVWDDFADDQQRLFSVAEAIRESIETGEITGLFDVDESFIEAPEGRVLTKMHLSRERNAALVVKRKALALKAKGALTCDACDFDFAKYYPSRGDGFIEAHHLKPLHTLVPGAKTRLEDLALLCANCHRMIHARQPWLTLEQLKGIIRCGCSVG